MSGAVAATIAVASGRAGLWAVTVGTLLVASFFVLTALRSRRVRAELGKGCLRVAVVGWTRAPDGCNFALFLSGDDPADGGDPDFVVRLATKRPTTMTEALVAGEFSAQSPVAILSSDGEDVEVGRVRDVWSASRVWARRNEGTPLYSLDPGLNTKPRV